LDERAAGVVADDGDVAQVETVEELGDEPRDPAQRQVCVGVHRVAVCPQRQRRHHAPVIDGEVGDHVIPEGGVHQEPVQQHEGRASAAGVLVVDRPGGQLDLVHRRYALRVLVHRSVAVSSRCRSRGRRCRHPR
jgi:hypothetical protein